VKRKGFRVGQRVQLKSDPSYQFTHGAQGFARARRKVCAAVPRALVENWGKARSQ